MRRFPQGILIILFVIGILGNVIGFDDVFHRFRFNTPLFGKIIDDPRPFFIDSFVEDVGKIAVHKVDRPFLIFLPNPFQDSGSHGIRLAEPRDFGIDFGKELAASVRIFDDEGTFVASGRFHQFQDIVLVDLVAMAAAKVVVDGQIDFRIVAVVSPFEFLFDIVKLAVIGINRRFIDAVVSFEVLFLIIGIDLQIGVGIVEFPIGF